MSSDAFVLVWVALGYLSGSVPYGVLVARGRGVDLQQEGSGNIGATNVARTLGKRAGLVVLLLDALKGVAPVAAARWLVGSEEGWVVAAVALAAVVGHCFPLWLRFRGGKGVATSLGVFLVLDPLASAISVVVFALVYALTRVASVGSLIAALAFPGLLWWWRGQPPRVALLALLVALLILVQHRDNLRRLLKGEEHRL